MKTTMNKFMMHKEFLLGKRVRHGVIAPSCSDYHYCTTQVFSTKPELRFCADSNPALGVTVIRDGEDL